MSRVVALPYKDFDTVEIDGKRHYNTPSGHQYLSVTTFLSVISDKSFLKEWEEREGWNAERIKNEASRRGNALHDMCEQYLLGNPDYSKGYDFEDILLFNAMKNKLKYISHVQYLECALYSDILRLAGRCDCVGYYKGNLSIIDFKNSKRMKREDWIENYFLQCTIYSIMIEEITGVRINQITILVAVDEMRTQEFIRDRRDYVHILMEKFKLFKCTYKDYFSKFL